MTDPFSALQASQVPPCGWRDLLTHPNGLWLLGAILVGVLTMLVTGSEAGFRLGLSVALLACAAALARYVDSWPPAVMLVVVVGLCGWMVWDGWREIR